MGQLQNNQRKGRAIKIKFSATFFKQEIYKNISKLNGNKNWEGIIVSDVLMQEEQSQRRDLRCIAVYVKSIDIDAKVRRDKLIIDEKHDDVDSLPHKLCIVCVCMYVCMYVFTSCLKPQGQ